MSAASTSEQVRQTIRTSEDRVFTTRDILNAAPEATRDLVDQVISRMVRIGEIQRVSRGLFSLPKMHASLGSLPPAAVDIAAAVERSIGVPVTPIGALVLNALHLSTQVPAKPEFLTAGPSRTIYVRHLPIRLKNASARRFRTVFETPPCASSSKRFARSGVIVLPKRSLARSARPSPTAIASIWASTSATPRSGCNRTCGRSPQHEFPRSRVPSRLTNARA